MKSTNLLKIGDWVKGESRNGELIIGYIEAFHTLEGVVQVKVITSDNTEIVGKTIQMLNKKVKSIPVSNIANKEQIRYLIDLALATGDKEWFKELSDKLKSMNQLLDGVTK